MVYGHHSLNGCKTSVCNNSMALNLWQRFVKTLFQIVQLLFSIPFTVQEGKNFEFSDTATHSYSA